MLYLSGTYIRDDEVETACRKDWIRLYLETKPGFNQPITDDLINQWNIDVLKGFMVSTFINININTDSKYFENFVFFSIGADYNNIVYTYYTIFYSCVLWHCACV